MLQINFKPFPVLESERLVLREIMETDVKEIFELRSDPEVMKYIPRPLAKTSEDALEFIRAMAKGLDEKFLINWAITLKGDNRLIGLICLIRMQPENYRSEIGYLLHRGSQGKGIVSEAAKAVIDYAFDTLKFHSLEAVIDPENGASERVLIRNGFLKEGHFKENAYFDGRFWDSAVYSLINRNPVN